MSNKRQLDLTQNLEDYLETIYNIEQKNGVARVRDIAFQLNVRAASVTGALQSLSQKGLINYTPYQYITMTNLGESKAKEIVKKHKMLKRFFIEVLGIGEDVADLGACNVEHAIPKDIMDRIVGFLDFAKEGRYTSVFDEFKNSFK